MAAVPMCGVFGYSMLLGAMGAGSDLITMPIFDADLSWNSYREIRSKHFPWFG